MELARQRASFIKQASHALGEKEETIHREVGKLWAVLDDFERCGVVGCFTWEKRT
jgi:hypothetical protein